MPVITISRQTGSGGMTIGQRLAERLQADYLNTQIIQQVAQRLGMSEANVKTTAHRGYKMLRKTVGGIAGEDRRAD